jgi:hypothetical protein
MACSPHGAEEIDADTAATFLRVRPKDPAL